MNKFRVKRMVAGRNIVNTVALFIVIVTTRGAHSQEMIFPGEQWTRATPESQLVDSSRLQKAISFLETNTPGSIGATELVIVRNGRMIHCFNLRVRNRTIRMLRMKFSAVF